MDKKSQMRNSRAMPELLPPPYLHGSWGEARWEFYTADTLPPDNIGPCTTAACVPICPQGPLMGAILLTQNRSEGNNSRRGNWELPGGHLDPIDLNNPDSPLESPHTAVRRETHEETGAKLGLLHPFGYRLVHNPPGASERKNYPPVSHMRYYWSPAINVPRPGSDPKHPASGAFTAPNLGRLVEAGTMDEVECLIALQGFFAATKHLRRES